MTVERGGGLIGGLPQSMADPISTTISILALSISAVTAWLTLFRGSTIKMTQPTVIFFGPDPGRADESPLPKVFLRALLFATSKRGRVIESMYVALSRNETRQNFNIWVYGNEKLARGSGLFVGETGVEANHHFLIPRDGSTFHFTEGRYRMDVFAKLLEIEPKCCSSRKSSKSHAKPQPFWKNPMLVCILIGGPTRRATCSTWTGDPCRPIQTDSWSYSGCRRIKESPKYCPASMA